MICSVGFTKQSKRQVRIWDSRNLDAGPVSQQDIDQSASKLSPFWEEDSRILFLCGKGSGSVRYYELSQDHKNLHYISDFKGTTQQKGITQLPKRACNSVKCEIARFCKLTSSGTVEPLVFKVPRRSEAFQKDIYPVSRLK